MYENMQFSNFIVYDIETYDPDLLKMGPGVFRSIPLDFKNMNGYVLGYSVLNEHGNKGYYNLGHYDCTPELREKNLIYLKQIMSGNGIKIGQNLIYDLDWTENWLGIEICGTLIDTMIAEALLDENQGFYNLDFMGKKYFNEGKRKTIIDRFCKENELKGDPRKWLYKMPHYMVEEYALGDVDLPMRIWKIQEPKLIEENLIDLMHLECDILPMLMLMRKTGVKIDVKRRELNAYEVTCKIEEIYYSLVEQIGYEFNFRATGHLVKIFDKFNLPYPLTEKGHPSITRDHLNRLGKGQLEYNTGIRDAETNEWIMAKITDELKCKIGSELSEVRRADKLLKSFLHGSLVKFVTEGDLIHGSFYNTKRDDFGTRSGRFSSANPNLQQIPSLGTYEYYGRLARSAFIPFDNCWWGKLDYSQIEYRFMAHFAVGPGSDIVRAQYAANPRTDYHQYIQDLTGLRRRYAKNLNFGVAYGMGAKHMSEFFQWDLDYCYDMLKIYHENAPFIKATMYKVQRIAKRRGYIKTFLKRRSRLIDPDKAYTMLCRLTQGSAADLMKKAMYDIYKAGIFDVLPPHLTVHDEIDLSIPKTKEGIEAFLEAKDIMENCLKIKVPIIADMEIGPNWADVEKIKGDLKFCSDALNKKLKEV